MSSILAEQQCYVGWHLFHTFWAILSILLFVGIAIVATMNLYEPRTCSKSFLARANSLGEVSLLIAKIALQLFFDTISDQWTLILIMAACAALLFVNQVLNRAYYYKSISKLIVRWNLLFVWSVCNVLVLKAIEGVNFSGGFIIWVIGLPFVVILGAGVVQLDNDLVPNPGAKSLSTSSLESVMRAILFLLSHQNEEPEQFEELTTFIQNHIEICNETDCPLKALKKEDEDFINPAASQAQILEALERMFLAALKKENSIRMRIDYAVFLIDYIGAQKRAIDELLLAQSFEPDFGQQFLIYRSQKLIEEGSVGEKSGRANKREVDVVGMIALESHSKIIVNSIRHLSELNRQFWTRLLEEQPQLQEFYAIGVDINSVSEKAQKNWLKLGALSGQNSLIDKLYSKFLANIMKKKAEAQAIIEQFENKIRQLIASTENDFSDLKETKAQFPVCVSQFSKKYNGQLRKANQNFIIMFGVHSNEVNSIKISDLIADVYCQSLRKPQRTWMAKLPSYPEYLGSQQSYHLKMFSGFIFEALCSTFQFSSVAVQSTESVFLTKFKCTNTTAAAAEILTGRFGEILNVNTLSQVYFDLAPMKILHTAPNLSQFFKQALTGEKYRRGTVTDVYSKSPEETAWFDVSVESLMSKILALEDENFYSMNEDKKLIGFAVYATKSIDKESNKDMLRKFINKAMYEPILKDRFIWDKIDPVFCLPNSKFRRESSEANAAKVKASRMSKPPVELEFKKTRPEKTSSTVVTKRLYKQRFVDVFAKKRFHFDDSGNEVLKEEPAPAESIFAKQLSKYHENDLNQVSIIKTNIVEQIEQKLKRTCKRFSLVLVATAIFAANFAMAVIIFSGKSSNTQGLSDDMQSFSKGLKLMLSNSITANAAYELKMSLLGVSAQLIPKAYQSLFGLSDYVEKFYEQALDDKFDVFDPADIPGMAKNSFDYLASLNLDYSLEPILNGNGPTDGLKFAQMVREKSQQLPNSALFLRTDPNLPENNSPPAHDRQLRYVAEFMVALATTKESSLFKLITMQCYYDSLFSWDKGLEEQMKAFEDSFALFGAINTSLAFLGIAVLLNLCYCLFFRFWRRKTRRESVRMLSLFLDIPKEKVAVFKRHADQFYHFCKVTSLELHAERSELRVARPRIVRQRRRAGPDDSQQDGRAGDPESQQL